MNLPPEQPLSQPDPELNVDQPRRSADQTRWHSLPDSTVAFPAQNGYVESDEANRTEAPVEATDDDLDLLAEVNHRPSRATVLLLAGILAAAAFVGGSVVQKHYGTTSSAGLPGAAAGGFGARAGNAGGYGGFGGGGAGFPGGGEAQGAAGGTAGGGAAGGGNAAGAAGGTAAAAAPVVVGTVTKLSGSSLTVKNLGGKSVKVKVPEGATITLVAGKSLTALKIGSTVNVAGKTATDGTVTATIITVRS